MSGGHFDYKQYHIGYIADEIENVIANNETKDEYGFSYSFSMETLSKLRYSIEQLRISEQLAKEIDYLLCSDTSEETFNKRFVDIVKGKHDRNKTNG